MTLIITKIRESLYGGNLERVCLLEVIMSDTFSYRLESVS